MYSESQINDLQKLETLESEKTISTDLGYTSTRLGIFSGNIGSGKTTLMIHLIERDMMKFDCEMPYTIETKSSDSSDWISFVKIQRYRKYNSTLVISSPSQLVEWKLIYEKLFPETDVVLLGTKRDVQKFAESVEIRDDEMEKVVLIEPGVYNLLVQLTGDIAWKRVIFDEVDNIKIPSMRVVHSSFLWFVVSNADSIYTRHFHCEGMVKKIIGESTKFITERFKDIIITNSNSFENRDIEKRYFGVSEYHSKYSNILDFQSNNVLNKDIDQCNICLGEIDLSNFIIDPRCNNAFCVDCIDNWISKSKSCPCCRRDTDKGNLILISDCEDDLESIIGIKRSIVYIDNTSAIVKFINKYNLSKDDHIVISGNSKKIEKVLERSDSVSTIIINSEDNSLGFSLYNIDTIIFYSPISPRFEKQLIGRIRDSTRICTYTIRE